MVLKNSDYFANTIQKIGLLGNENHFYPTEKKKNKRLNSNFESFGGKRN